MKTASSEKPSFTLVELLIVVSIIGILSGLVIAVINPSSLQKKAKDANRQKNLAVIGAALEQYYADNNAYPSPGGIAQLQSSLVGNYLSIMPPDPDGLDAYCYLSDGQSFQLCTVQDILETQLNGVVDCHSPVPARADGSAYNLYCLPSPF